MRYDHLQAAKNSNMIVNGVATDSLSLAAATHTDKEVYRSYINPGFDGTLDFLEFKYYFMATGTATANTLSGKWQIRSRGETTWTDLGSIPSIALTAGAQVVNGAIFYDAVAATNTSPWELRLLISTTASTTLVLAFYSSGTGHLTTRTVGESV